MNALIVATIVALFAANVSARRLCDKRVIAGADTVCVCNATYCDDMPALPTPTKGVATVFESNKGGDRFVESRLDFASVRPPNGSQSVEIRVKAEQRFQRVLGFGGAFTDTAGQMLSSVPASLAEAVLQSYFGADGIGYSFCRVPMAGTDYSPRPYSYDDVDGDLQLKHFALQKEDLEWKIPFIRRAQQMSPLPLRLFASPWAPPAWMKDNHKVNESGALIGAVGGAYYEAWAQYFVRFLDAYRREHDISFWGLTAENEPLQGMLNKRHPFNCLNLSAESEAQFVARNLGPALRTAGYGDLVLLVYDDAGKEVKDYAEAARVAAAEFVGGVAFHWYANDVMKHGFPDSALDSLHALYPDWLVINSEACHLKGLGVGDWQYGLRYAFDVIRDLNHWVSAWIEWNLALDMNGGPRWPEKQGYGGAVNVDAERGEALKNPSFYTLAHFSKFISPESVRIGREVSAEDDLVSVLTVQRPDNQTVLVALNADSAERVLNVEFEGKWISHRIPGFGIQSYIW